MVTYNKRLQDMFHDYEKELGKPGSLRDAIEWGLNTGRLQRPQIDPVTILVGDLKQALRSETRIDDQGREYRANAAITFTDAGGIQTSFWGDVDRKSTPDDFMVEHFAQRRKGIVDDCVKLKADVDHYNATPGRMVQLPLILDFSEDVAEREAMRDDGEKAA